MILDSIVLENFGVYGGRREITLTPTKPNRPIILFGGMNGGGKTTLLDAVQLAFYGPKARCSNRGKLSYRDYLRETIHRGADPMKGAAVEIHFRRVVDGTMHSYRLVRSWHDGPRGIEDQLQVICDGELDMLHTEHWDEYIESYIPSGIAHLFFFDAEQIKELAEGEHAAEILGTAIHSLLGLDLVDRLQTDLVTLERRKRTEGKTGEETKRLKHADEEAVRMERLLDEATQERGRLDSEAIQLARALTRCEEQFRLEGGDLFARRNELETEQERLRREIAANEKILRELAAGAAPLLLVANLLERTEEQSRKENEARKSEVLLVALEDRDSAVLRVLRRAKIPVAYRSRMEEVLRDDRKARRKLLTEPCFLDADDHLGTELRHLRSSVLPELAKRIKVELGVVASLREQLIRIETQIARVPAAEAIAGLQREVEMHRQKNREKVGAIEAQDAKLVVLARQLEAAKVAHQRELGEEVDERESREDQSRILKHSVRIRNTLEQFRVSIISKHAEKIERLMLESFTQLLRKKHLVTGLKIRPDTYHIELTGEDGKPLPLDRLSAGERQLLATSLLWGLARASGRPLPTIIDTPLGRLDSSHRRHLVERYFPVASHQVILLSTDEEIDRENLERLRPYVGRIYHLVFDEKLRSTTVTPGYFWNHENTP